MSAIAALVNLDIYLAWVIVGGIIAILEMIATTGFFIPFALSAWGVAAKILMFGKGGQTSDTMDLLIFSIVGVVLIIPLRKLLRRYADKPPDINTY